MAGFDPDKMKTLFNKDAQVGDNMVIEIKVAQYNMGTPKIYFTRKKLPEADKGHKNVSYRKLGGVTLDEWRIIAPLIIDATIFIEDFEKTPKNDNKDVKEDMSDIKNTPEDLAGPSLTKKASGGN